MIVEQRVYTLAPGNLAPYLAEYEAHGLPVQLPILGRLVGYFTTEFGTLNQVVHMWAYEDLEQRRVRRERLQKNPEWAAYVGRIRPLMIRQENQLLLPTRFSPTLPDDQAVEPEELS